MRESPLHLPNKICCPFHSVTSIIVHWARHFPQALPHAPNVRTVITSPLQGPWHLQSPAMSSNSPPAAKMTPRSPSTQTCIFWAQTWITFIKTSCLSLGAKDESPALEGAYSLTLKFAISACFVVLFSIKISPFLLDPTKIHQSSTEMGHEGIDAKDSPCTPRIICIPF